MENTTMAKLNPMTMLKQDHQKVKELLSQLSETTGRGVKKRQQLVAQIEAELRVHMEIEEQIFYPALREAAKTQDEQKMYFEATEEHHAAKTVLQDLLATDPSTPNFAGKAKVLKELIEHHVKEEEKDLFAQAKETIPAEELTELAERMQERKTQLTARKQRREEVSPFQA
jgi:hemerythrin-like domain-containing protein